MAVFDFKGKALALKVVYYGCALGGKTTNLATLHRLTDPENRQGLVSIATKQDRTLFFDLLPIDLGQVAGLTVRVKVYTVPGQVHYELTRRQVLLGADAVVLVIDSSPAVQDGNAWAAENLRLNLRHVGLDPDAVPVVLQWNKRDLPDARPVKELEARFNTRELPAAESVATTGVGVVETFVLAVEAALCAAYDKAGKKAPSEEELERMVSRPLETARQNAPAMPDAASPVFEHTFDSDAYRDEWADKGRDRQIVDQETLLAEAVQTGMELAEQLDGLRSAQATNARRQKMFGMLNHLGVQLSDPARPALPKNLLRELLAACGRRQGSLLLFQHGASRMDEREVVPPGDDPLNVAVASLGSTAFRLSQGEKPRLVKDLSSEVFFDAVPPGAENLASCFVVPVSCAGTKFGALLAYSLLDERQFAPAELDFWATAAILLGLSLHWRGLRRKLAEATSRLGAG